MRSFTFGFAAALALAALVAASRTPATATTTATTTAAAVAAAAATADEHAGHDMGPAAVPQVAVVADTTLPAGAAEAEARLAASPRHAEWVTVPNGTDSTRAWVVYPESRERAPVVIVVHEIFGLSPWIRAVADQLAAEGFIAVAPDLLTRYGVPGSPTNPNPDSARAAIRNVGTDDMNRQVSAVAQWAMKLPAAQPRYGIVGFCWGGSASFNHAVLSPTGLGASVVYYGTSPQAAQLASVRVPVLGLYGGDDARVNATVPPADSAMRALGRTFEHHTYAGAGHGFLRQQDGRDGANLAATRQAWPATVAWFRTHLGGVPVRKE